MNNIEGSSRTPEAGPLQSRWREFRAVCLDPRTLRFKALYVTLFAGVVVVWVQLGPYQKSLGLTESDTGVMSIVGSSMIIVGPMFSGMWADALGDFRRLVAATALLNGIVAFGFTLVPHSPLIGNVSLTTYNSSANLCPETPNSSGNNLPELHHSPGLNQSLNLSKSKLSQDYDSAELSSIIPGLTSETLLTTHFSRPSNDGSDTVVVLEDDSTYYIVNNASFVRYNLSSVDIESVPSLSYNQTSGLDDQMAQQDAEDSGKTAATPGKLATKFVTCATEEQTADDYGNVGARTVTYWTYLALHASFMLLNSATISLFESAVLAEVSEHGLNYGHQRCFASLAATISAPVGGLLVDLTGSREHKSNYRTALYASCGLMVVSSALLLNMDMSFKKPAATRLKGLPSMFTNVRLLTLFFVTFLAGLLMGYGETFVYRYLHELGASGSLLGATVTVGGCIEGILLLFLSRILTLTGAYVCFAAGFVCFSLKFLGLYLLQEPALALLLEALDSISTGMFMAVASVHLTALVPCEALASTRGLLGTAYMGVGKMTGAAVGTAVVEAFGTRPSWAIMSAAAGTIALLVALGTLLFKSRTKSDMFKINSSRSLQTVCVD